MAMPASAAAVVAGPQAAPVQASVCASGGMTVLRAAHAALAAGQGGCLALVVETEGSTYAGAGALAFFGEHAQAGWLSGGCLEPEIAVQARRATAHGQLGWMELDTREDAALFSGAASGCRGRLRLALLPLAALDGLQPVLRDWLHGGHALRFALGLDGQVRAASRGERIWRLDAAAPAWQGPAVQWALEVPRPPEVLLLGAGPEAATLLPLLRALGWHVAVAERRLRWQAQDGMPFDAWHGLAPAQAVAAAAPRDAALVMHHSFELDLEALEALAATAVPFVGLLGPVRRRDDLLGLLPPAQRAGLLARLHAPVGLDLGGRGPEAIALSIAAQLQTLRAGAPAR